MKISLAIVGLGQIGASVGMALADQDQLIHRIGYDSNPEIRDQASELNAVDEMATQLENIPPHADIILLALPTDQVQAMLAKIAPLMKSGAVLMDTALSKERVSQWAAELLPEGCCYVGLTPVINPAYLMSASSGIQSAHADFFQNGMIAISSPPHTDPKAIKLAGDLTRLLGASLLFADMLEVDSLMAATHVVPQLMAAALLNATVDQPNWREASQMAGRAYAEVSGPIRHLGRPGTLAATAIQNREHVLRVLDSVIASMETLRDNIAAEEKEMLNKRLERAHKGRDQWWQERLPEGQQPANSARTKQSQGSSFFGNLLRASNRKTKEETGR